MGMWDKFEFKASLNFTGYAERAVATDKEFRRVGLEGIHRIWQFPNPFDGIVQRSVLTNRAMQGKGFFNATMGHYRAIKTAYELGSANCLVMEDDIRFLTDLNLLADILDDIPDDYDAVLLDVIKPVRLTVEEVVRNIASNRVGKYWVRFSNMRSFGCYSLSRRGMQRWIGAVENALRGTGAKLRIADQYMRTIGTRMGEDARLYHASPNAAIQVPIGKGNCNSGFVDLAAFYRAIGCKPEEYGG